MGLLLIAALAVPFFLDPNQYKTEIQSEFEAATGYTLDVDGEISLSVLPSLEVSAQEVRIYNRQQKLVEVQEISAFAEIMPLLSGEFKIGSVELKNPQISLVKTKERGGNWELASKGGVDELPEEFRPVETAPKPPAQDFAINDITISGGELVYDDRVKGEKYQLSSINLDAALGGANGPLDFDGSAIFGDENLQLSGEVQDFKNFQMAVDVSFGANQISAEGDFKQMNLSVQAPDVNLLLTKFAPGSGFSFPNPKANISAKLKITDTLIDATDIKASLGGSSAIAVARVQLADNAVGVAANVKFRNLIVDELMPQSPEKSGGATAQTKKNQGNAVAKDDLSKFYGSFKISADKLQYQNLKLSDLDATLRMEDSELSVEPVSVKLPGGQFELFGLLGENATVGKYFDGKISTSGKDLRGLLTDAGIDLAAIKSDSLKKFSFGSDVYVRLDDGPQIELSSIKSKFDDTSFSGKVELGLANADLPKISVNGSSNFVDLDKLLVAETPSQKVAREAEEAQRKSRKNLDLSWLSQFPIDLNMNFGIGRITHNEDNYDRIKLQLAAKPGQLDVQSFSFASEKVSAAGNASLNNAGKRPKFVVNASVSAVDTKALMGEEESGSGASSASQAKKTNEPRWSAEAIDFWPLDLIDGELNLNARRIAHGKMILDNVDLKAELQDAQLTIREFAANAFRGALDARGVLDVRKVPAFNFNFSGTGIDLASVSRELLENTNIEQSYANITGNISSSGANEKSLIQNLGGNFGFVAQKMVVRGFDLEAFAHQVTNINDASAIVGFARLASDDNARSYINRISGRFYIENGTGTFQDFAMDAGAAQGTYTGNMNFVDWIMKTKAEFRIVMPDEKERPPLWINIAGDISEPKMDLDYSEIRRYVTKRAADKLLDKTGLGRKIEGFQDKIDGKLGDKLNNFLGGFGR